MEMCVILYYKYVKIKKPMALQKQHLELCKSLGLKGRIIIAKEGINGTVSGTKENIKTYKEEFRKNPLFTDIEFKDDLLQGHVFKKIFVRVKKEIVHFWAKVNLKKAGPKIMPEELERLIADKEDITILDVRNNYETKVGKFHGAITLDIDNFRDFSNKINEINYLRNKKIITYCTGGVRCEKASAYLIQNGFKEVLQLHGGILNYNKKCPNSYFEGKCFVFDNRVLVPINKGEHAKIISHCGICGKSCDIYINCCNVECNKLFICCEECQEKMDLACSVPCSMNDKKRVIT